MYHKPPAVIIDAGTVGIKYGLEIDEEPDVFPSKIARVRNLTNLPMSRKSYYVGKDTQTLNTAVDCFMSNPIKNRVVKDWDGMEKLWSYTFEEVLRLREYRDRNIVLAEPTLTPSSHRDKTLQYMFEKYKFGGVYIGDASALALRFAHISTGLVVDSGEEVTQVVPIHNGHIDEKMVQSMPLGGKSVTKYLGLLLAPQLNQCKVFNYDIIREIKESMCNVSLNYKQDMKTKAKFPARYPTGPLPTDHIKFDVERIQCTELLFHPTQDILRSIPPGTRGISKVIFETVQNHDPYLQKQLYHNMVLAGGNTMFKGMRERLKLSLKALQKVNNVPKLEPSFTTPEVAKLNYPTWQGALLVTKSAEMEKFLISKADYQERGIAKLSKAKSLKTKRLIKI